MPSRGKLPLIRKILARLPKIVRYPLMRKQIRVSRELDPRFSFRIARTQSELSNAYRILHDCYVDLGYSKQHISGMRIVKYFALPTTTTLIACYDDDVIGTISIIKRGAFGLPMESIFNLNPFIEKNEAIAEISSLAVDKNFREKQGKLFLPLVKYMWEYVVRYMSLEVMTITVNPSMSDFYEAFLGFKVLPQNQSQVPNYDFANGHPGVGLYLDLREAPDWMIKKYDARPVVNNLFEYFVRTRLEHFKFPDRRYYKTSDPVMTPEMIKYFFKVRSTVLQTLTDQESWALSSLYPFATYESVLPMVPINKLRSETRFSSKIKAKIPISPDSVLNVLEVSAGGLCVESSKPLNGLVMLRVEIANGLISELRGEVRWSDPAKHIYGLKLMRSDDQWKDFISYLEEDFNELLEMDKVSNF